MEVFDVVTIFCYVIYAGCTIFCFWQRGIRYVRIAVGLIWFSIFLFANEPVKWFAVPGIILACKALMSLLEEEIKKKSPIGIQEQEKQES